MSIRTEAFTVVGVTSGDVKDAGIQSVDGERPKRLIAVNLRVSAYNAAIIKCFQGQVQKQGAYDYAFAGYAAIASGTDFNGALRQGFAVDMVLPVGNPYQVAVGAASTGTTIFGEYVYEQDDE